MAEQEKKKEKFVNVSGAAVITVGGGLRYVGDGSYLPGVPARDLTAEEAAEHAERYAMTPSWLSLYVPLPVDDPAEQEE